MLFSLSGPLILSFDKRVAYFKKWKYLPIGILSTLFIFIIWDICFTKIGVWSFNDKFILGYKLLHLPIEEWLFFIIIPFACLFVYECTNYYINKDILKKYTKYINYSLLFILFTNVILFYDKLYTLINFSFTIVLLLIHIFIIKPNWLSKFYVGYIFSLIPFLLVNGVLTYLPVVEYNNNENMGIRIISIPIEDIMYSFNMILMNISIYEKMKLSQNA